MKRAIWILAFCLAAISPQFVFATNPASVGDLQAQVNILQTQINNLTLPTYNLGDFAQGGVVFWLDPTRQHGLVAAIEDQNRMGLVQWLPGMGPFSLLGTFANGVSLGYPNTFYIFESTGSTGYAAQLCFSYHGGGYRDWYLPSAIEATLMFERVDFINATSVAQGGAAMDTIHPYWTSLEVSSGNADAIDFSTGAVTSTVKSTAYNARAIRAF